MEQLDGVQTRLTGAPRPARRAMRRARGYMRSALTPPDRPPKAVARRCRRAHCSTRTRGRALPARAASTRAMTNTDRSESAVVSRIDQQAYRHRSRAPTRVCPAFPQRDATDGRRVAARTEMRRDLQPNIATCIEGIVRYYGVKT